MSVLATTQSDLSSGATLEELKSGDDMDKNHGTITTNNGEIDQNHGTVTTNNGEIIYNYGTVTTNKNDIGNNYGTITTNTSTINTNYGIVTNTDDGKVSCNEADGSVTGGVIDFVMNGGTAKNCFIRAEIDIYGIIRGGMRGGEATNCSITVMSGGTATDCTIDMMIDGTARGANTVIKDYQGGDVSELVPLDNIKDGSGNPVAEENVRRVDPIPAEMSGGGSTPSGGAAVSTPEPVIPESPYRVFLFDTVPQVKNAAQGASVELKMDGWNTLPLWFMKEIAARRDVTINLTYRYQAKKYDVTFPAGMVIALDEKIPYYGPLKLADMAMRSGGICNITQ